MEAKKRALEIAQMSEKEQQVVLQEEFNKSVETGLKMTTEFVSIVKQADGNNNENYKKFQDSCDNAINVLTDTLKDGEVTEKEKEDVRNKIVEIEKIWADANIKVYNSNNETKKIAFNAAAKVGVTTVIAAGAVTALKIICNTILKSKR